MNRLAAGVLVGCLLFSESVHAQWFMPPPPMPMPMPAPVLPPPVDLNVPVKTQSTLVWCWLAVSEMVLLYRNGNAPTQCQMIEAAHALPPNTCCANPGQCARTAFGMAEIQLVLQRFGGVHSAYAPPSDPMTLYGTLAQGNPVIVEVRTGFASSHVVVVRGMRFSPVMVMTPFGPQTEVVPLLRINDPMSIWPGEVPYMQVAQAWMSSIVVGRSLLAKPVP